MFGPVYAVQGGCLDVVCRVVGINAWEICGFGFCGFAQQYSILAPVYSAGEVFDYKDVVGVICAVCTGFDAVFVYAYSPNAYFKELVLDSLARIVLFSSFFTIISTGKMMK